MSAVSMMLLPVDTAGIAGLVLALVLGRMHG
jgi:hypothetical protein